MLTMSVGCGSKPAGEAKKELIKVKGVVTVNKEVPAYPISITCVDMENVGGTVTTISSATTDEQGAFEMTTYEPGDGIPPGSYAITAVAQEYNALMRRPIGVDALGEKYNIPQKSPKKFEVKAGDGPIDLGTINLVGAKKKKK